MVGLNSSPSAQLLGRKGLHSMQNVCEEIPCCASRVDSHINQEALLNRAC